MEIVLGAGVFGSVGTWLVDAFLPCIFLLYPFASSIVLSVASVVCNAFTNLVDNDFSSLNAEMRSFTLLQDMEPPIIHPKAV